MLDPLDEHYGYLSDRVKRERYQAAIKRVVRPGQVVMDLGCGTGLLGLMALRAGADKVLFVEEYAIIEVARRAVLEAGFGDRSQFFNVNSSELELPERVDVILCDHVGYFGCDYDILGLLDDARQRFLTSDGIIVPSGVELMLAPVETENGRELVNRWRDGTVPEDYAWVAAPASNTKRGIDLDAGDLIAEPASLGILELGSKTSDFFTWRADFIFARDATLDGLAGWFDCALHDDIRMTNAPTAENKLDRPQAFLPLQEPVLVRAGQRLKATIMARPHDHVIAWTITLPDTGQTFEQSTFNSLALDNALRKKLVEGPGE
jgi:protein arginine N-methyltransferase 1